MGEFEESDSALARGARLVTDNVQDIFGGVFKNSELSATLTEIVKIDPTFDREAFLKECETDIIPNVLEAMTRGILKFWRTGAMRPPSTFLQLPLETRRLWG